MRTEPGREPESGVARVLRGIALEAYEQHRADVRVSQLQRLHDITAEQLASFPARTIGILGVAGGNGLDLVDPSSADAVYGYDINPDYLHACNTRYRVTFGERLHLVEGTINRSLKIDADDLTTAMSDAGFVPLGRTEYPLPNGKTLIRQDFRAAGAEPQVAPR